MVKALREAKVHSSWLNPNEAYEYAMREFISHILTPTRSRAFFKDFLPFQEQIAHYGIVNSLSQVLLKVTAPGIPDFYQGTERWDLNLVDPDNRRPVDYETARAALTHLRTTQDHQGTLGLLQELLEHPENGYLKLWTTTVAPSLPTRTGFIILQRSLPPTRFRRSTSATCMRPLLEYRKTR